METAPFWSRLDFSARLAAHGLFTARQAWRRALATDDAVLAVDLARHRKVPAPAASAQEDWLCRLLAEAVATSMPINGQALRRDPSTGLTVVGAILAAGASPRLNTAEQGGAMPVLWSAMSKGRLDEVRLMLHACPAAIEESRAMSLLLGISPLPWLEGSRGRAGVRSCYATRIAARFAFAELTRWEREESAARWSVFKHLIEGLPEASRKAAIASCDLQRFFERSGMREPLDWLVAAGLADPCGLLAVEIATTNRPRVVDMLLDITTARSPSGRLPRTCLSDALLNYVPRPEDCRDASGLAQSLRRLAMVTDDLGGCDASGDTLSHTLAHCRALASDGLTATAAEALRAAGLQDQSSRRDACNLTPVQAVAWREPYRWSAAAMDHCASALAASALAARMASTSAPVSRRRLS